MHCNVFLSLGIFQLFGTLLGMGHKCAFLNNSVNNSDCDLTNKAKCKKETCSEDKRGCVSVYKNISGSLRPLWMGCMDKETLWQIDICGGNTCPLAYHNGHYTCCCHSNMCNINVTLPV